MAKRPTINTLTNTASPTYLTQLNQNFTNVRNQFDNTLSLDGSTPNAMNADIDLNGNDLINAGSVNTATLRIGGQVVSPSETVVVDSVAVKKEFDTVALLLADTGTYTNYAAGDYFRVVNGGFTYEVAASGASDQHVTTAGGAKLYVLPDAGGYNIKAFGAVSNGSTDDATAVRAAVDAAWNAGGGTVIFPTGNTRVQSSIDVYKSAAKPITLQGLGGSIVSTTQDIVLFEIAESVNADNLTITQSGTAKTGRAFSTPTTKQIASNRFSRLTINNFKYGFWLRYSLWSVWDTVQFSNCACGIKFSRNALPNDQTNPSAPGAWNADPGFFHNENVLTNVVCDGGEVGIWGTVNGCVFDAVTCQGQSSSTGSGNVVLPAAMQGTGLWLQGSADAVGSTFGAQGNVISHYYAEFTRQPMIFERCQVRLSSFYVQGGDVGAKYPQAIKASYGAIIRGQDCAASGSDWFDYQVVANNSTLLGEVGVGATPGNASSLTSSTWYRGDGSGAGVNVRFGLTGLGLTQTLYTMPNRIGAVQVVCTVLRDGSAIRYGTWTVYFHQSGFSAAIADSGNSLAATVTVSGSDIVYTTTEALSHDVNCHVIPLALLGQTRNTGLYLV